MTGSSSHRGVLPLLMLSLMAVVAWAALCWPGLYSLHLRWSRLDESYALGYPAVLLAVWWLWRHRRALRRRGLAPTWAALVIFAGALLLAAVGELVQLQLFQQLGAVGMLWAGAATVAGWRAGRLLLFPALLVLLAVPVWDFLVDPLRAMTVWSNQHVLDWLRIPALIDGFFIHLPAGTLEVAGSCSGLNLLLAMTLVGLLFAESHELPSARRIAIVLLAMGIGVVDNWIRVLVLVRLAHSSQMQSELLHNHGNLGWWIFAASLLPYFWLASRIERRGHPQQLAAGAAARQEMSAQWPRMAAAALVVTIATATTYAGVAVLEHRRGQAANGFAGPAAAASAAPTWLPRYRGQDVAQTWRASIAGRDAELTALTYVAQSADKKLIYYSNVIAGEYELRPLGRIPVTQGFDVNAAVVESDLSRAVWWYWWVDGATSTSPLKTKLLQLRAMLFGDPSAALIALSVACARSECARVSEELTPALMPLLLESRQMPLAR